MAIISIPTSVGGVALPGQLGKAASGPLSLLYQGKGVEKFHYPMDLAKDPSKSHYVEFFIKEIVPAGYKTKPGTSIDTKSAKTFNPLGNTLGTNTALGGLVNNVSQSLNGSITSGTQSIANYVGGNVGQAVSAVGETVKATLNAAVSVLTEGVQITPQTTVAKSFISLYMPDTLTAEYSQSYEQVGIRDSVGTLVNTVRGIDQAAGKAIDTFISSGGISNSSDAVIRAAKNAFSSVSSDPGAISTITNILGSVTSQGFGDILLQAKGYSFNPQLQMIYRGTGFRKFQLSFTFTPNSKQEAQMVDNIIYTFKYFSAPTLANSTKSSIENMFLIPPAIFNVKFKINGSENTYLPKYADCVLDDIAVNYAPNGFAAHVDGAPIQTQLTLSFTEIEIVERDRLSKGYNNPSDDQGLR